ncbi:MAG: helix-turn-helix domain-containing protein [Candidatus Gracilibacteria bacterium]|jgi:sugar-specific transcriptional regulator TrmB
MNLQNVLNNIGLNAKESKVYLAALELGPSPASEIALRAKLNRVSTYDVLQKLMERGYISQAIKNRIKTFTATEPDLLRMDFRQKYLEFKEALPDLRRLHGSTYIPRIRYYEGIEGVKKVYADTLSTKTEILNYADSKSIREHWPTYDKDYVNERVKRRIYLRGIAPLDEHGERVAAENEKKHREIRLVKAGSFAFSNEINIYDDKISIVSFGKNEVVGMIIESPEIANTQRAIFMMAWEFAGNATRREED